ncbi:MAG: CopD family protein [Bacteroidia bacterium]|nr:CopD family protein [Bacteroidia bacterium]
MNPSWFPYLLATHIVFVVTWFAGLFYIPRLFIYHTESQQKNEPERTILSDQFKIMEKRLWYGITWPSMLLTYLLGFSVASLNASYYFASGWFFIKLAFVFGLTLYHLQCGIIFKQLQNDIFKWSGIKLRFWNELATLFLVAIVFIVVLKEQGNFWWGIIGLVLFSALLVISILIYRKKRKATIVPPIDSGTEEGK